MGVKLQRLGNLGKAKALKSSHQTRLLTEKNARNLQKFTKIYKK
jgi:hypothetical protein